MLVNHVAVNRRMNTLPFTYLIGWSKHGIFYYGVRYARGCHPADLWTTYFTSSGPVKRFRMKHGDPDIVKIRRIFTCAQAARNWELRVLKRMHVVLREDFLNQTDKPCPGGTWQKDPIKKAIALKKCKLGGIGAKISAAKKGKPFSDAHRAALSEAAKRRAATKAGRDHLASNGAKAKGRLRSSSTKAAITEGLKRYHAGRQSTLS